MEGREEVTWLSHVCKLVKRAWAQIKDDIDATGIDRQELLSWAIQTLMAAATIEVTVSLSQELLSATPGANVLAAVLTRTAGA